MASRSKATAFGFRPFLIFIFLFGCRISNPVLCQLADNSTGSHDFLLPDDQDRSSVKKELRLPNSRWTGTGLSEEEEVEPIRGVYLDEASKELASFLRRISNEEIGVTALQSLYDSLSFGVFERDDVFRVKEMSQKLAGKLNHYLNLVNHSRNALEELFWSHLHRPLTTAIPCCEVPNSIMR